MQDPPSGESCHDPWPQERGALQHDFLGLRVLSATAVPSLHLLWWTPGALHQRTLVIAASFLLGLEGALQALFEVPAAR